MDALQNLKERRSIRRYKADMLPRETIETIAEAGTYAPTGKNRQSPIIIAVTNKELRDKMSALNAKVMCLLPAPARKTMCISLSERYGKEL